jgi:uncharacterized OsmC-like protein
MTARIIYEGNLRCSCEHLQSGTLIETDAPTDNRGKGERFSPTDTVCVALATCAITTMGIRAQDMNIDFRGTVIDVTKHMLSNPRRIGKIGLLLKLKTSIALDEHTKMIFQKIAETCPVKQSLHPDLETDIHYEWES